MATQEDDDDFERATKLSEITNTSQVDSIPLGMWLGCIYLSTKLNMDTLSMLHQRGIWHGDILKNKATYMRGSTNTGWHINAHHVKKLYTHER